MKCFSVVLLCAVILSVSAYPQSRNKQLKFKPKTSRQELPPATPTPVASNSTPSVVASTERPKAAAEAVSSVAPPASVTTTTGAVTTISPPKSSTVVPQNATTVRPEDGEDEDDDSSEEEEDADVDSDVEEEDFEEGPPPGPPGPPGPEGDIGFGSDEDEDEDDRAADQGFIVQQPQPIQKPTKKNKKGPNNEAKVRETSGGIDAYVPGYVTDQGEVLVPIDTLERGLQYTIISDRYVSIPQQRSPTQRRNPVFVYRQDPAAAKVKPEVEESSEEEPPPEVYPVKVSETSVIFATKAPQVNETQKQEESSSGNTSQSSESSEDEDDTADSVPSKSSEIEKPAPLGVVPATRPTGEDDEDEVVGQRRANNIYRRNFYAPRRHFEYTPQLDYMNNIYDNRRMDYPVMGDPYSQNFYRSYGRVQPISYNGPYGDASYEDSSEDFSQSGYYGY